MITIQKKSVHVGKYVDTNHVDTVIRNYKQERWLQNSQRLGKEDSLSVWFSVEEVEGFLNKIKSSGGDGIKFYFGAYSKEFPQRPEYAGRQTIVMVGTKSKESANGIVDKDIYVDNGNTNSILAFNLGRVCPPMCKPGLDDGEIGITIVDKGQDGIVLI
jgi:hypothetical protein